MNIEDYKKQKLRELKEQGFNSFQSNAIMQQGGSMFDYQKTGNQAIAQSDVNKINQNTGIEFTPEFSNSYFSTQNQPQQATQTTKIDYSQMPIQDITSDGQWSNRKVWRTQKPEWFIGKKEPVEGQDYTTVPYKQWENYQNSSEYQKYLNPQMQLGGSAVYPNQNPTAYNSSMQYPSIMNNYSPNMGVGKPAPLTEPDFGESPFYSQNYANQFGNESISNYQFSDEPRQQGDQTQTAPAQQEQYNITRYNIDNPYGGVSLENSINYAGQGFGSGNAYQAALGTGLSALKGARGFLSGFATGKENERVKKEQFDDIYNQKINYQYAQEGGKAELSNAAILTGEFVVDQGYGNYNVEGNEYIKRAKTGEVQQVVGDPHVKNGKIADGVNVTLENGDKVLSDYTKIPAKSVKELKERYNISLKKGATFADAQKAYDRKLGIKKETEELTTLIEKYGKNASVEDETTKKLNDVVLSKEISTSKEKLDLLGTPQAMMFEDLFKIQESIPKKSGGNVLLDDKGKPIQEESDVRQQGGEIEDLAKKFGISLERAHELLTMQEGGQLMQQEQQQPTPEQVMQFVAQSLQAGATPEEVLAQLLQNGIPQEAAQQLVSQVLQQIQAPQEGSIPVAQEGGEKNYMQVAGTVEASPGFSFSTRYKPTIVGYDVNGKSIVDQDTLSDVEPVQVYTGTGYGKQMQDVEKTISLHDWYFDTDAKKEAFRDAAKKQGRQPEIEAFQNAYNVELLKRGEKAGVPKKELNEIVNKVGFNSTGVQQTDGLFGAYTSTRPLYDFSKANGEVVVEEIVPEVGQQKNVTKTVFPNFPDNLRVAPSALSPIYKEQIALPRAEPNKLTTEPFLASQESQRQADVARVQETGLPPQLQEAILAQGLATSQLSANDAIAKVETANQANQAQVDQFNLNQRSKEDIANAQFNQQYQSQVLGGISNYERDLRNYYNDINSQNSANYNSVEAANLLNAQSSRYAYIPGQGIEFFDNRPVVTPIGKPTDEWYKTATPAQIEAYVQSEIEKNKVDELKKYKTTIKRAS